MLSATCFSLIAASFTRYIADAAFDHGGTDGSISMSLYHLKYMII